MKGNKKGPVSRAFNKKMSASKLSADPRAKPIYELYDDVK